jgi:hypothetical protein
MARYFIRSRRLARKLVGPHVALGFREVTAEEAEPMIAAKDRKEIAEAAKDHGCVKPRVLFPKEL